jgi:hypothetical protein
MNRYVPVKIVMAAIVVPRYLPRQDMDVDASCGIYSQGDKRYDHEERACHNERSHHDERCSGERGRYTPDRVRSQLGFARALLAGWILAVLRFIRWHNVTPRYSTVGHRRALARLSLGFDQSAPLTSFRSVAHGVPVVAFS